MASLFQPHRVEVAGFLVHLLYLSPGFDPWKKSADPFLQRGGAWEGFVFVLVFVMFTSPLMLGYGFAASGSSAFFCFFYVSNVPVDPNGMQVMHSDDYHQDVVTVTAGDAGDAW